MKTEEYVQQVGKQIMLQTLYQYSEWGNKSCYKHCISTANGETNHVTNIVSLHLSRIDITTSIGNIVTFFFA